ncbi:MAG: carbamate kinase [Candidatus Thermoplasmatota archaeon]|nr:carbamate kinase [Candidatus Thermoplasmatota archaeon]
MKVVVALGGNALIKPGQKGTSEEQFATAMQSVNNIVKMIKNGWEVAITHGNGPQVGSILLQQDVAKSVIAPMPLDVCVAQSQGQIGYMIQQCMLNSLALNGIKKNVAAIVTQVLVDENDPAFKNPTKPVGPTYKYDEALLRLKEGYIMGRQKGGWRIVVPSPDPITIIEGETIKKLTDDGVIVIAVGGGGIPVVKKGGKTVKIEGKEAVIDKDLASERLAAVINADLLLILTNVECVYLNYGSENQKRLKKVKLSEIKKYYHQGQFSPGSMGPKILAAIRFLENGGERAIISSIGNAWKAIEGKTGTQIVN